MNITTLLWTNPYTSLPATDIIVGDVSAYRFVDIEVSFVEGTTGIDAPVVIQRYEIGTGGVCYIVVLDETTTGYPCINFCSRRFYWKNSTTIYFGNGHMFYQGNDYKNWGNRCVPRKIWGVK